ncbi:MAG: hypothetical protein AUG44_25430 [Actinobacteria bacterium 13_1_20CM_3_71_11]|nr:MAG: hypothetical protein AUG44_25430 [Actinobacteria bacterium 13_1_20CM_3_71_11]
MRIAYAADDENDTTRAVVTYLEEQGHEVVAVAPAQPWPQLGAAVGAAVAGGEVDYGVVLCWTGTGTAIAANKLALSLKRLAPDVAVEVVQAFLDTTESDPDERANIERLRELEG